MTVNLNHLDTASPMITPPRKAIRPITVIVWLLRLALAVGLAGAGSQKIAGAHQMVHLFSQIGAGQWLRYVVGALEISGALGMLLRPLTALAGLGVIALMLGATLTNLAVIHTSPAAPLAFLALAAAITWARRSDLHSVAARLTAHQPS